jgi:hypothetical protein
MNIEQLIAKGVKKHFTGQETLFEVESLKEHYKGLQIHKSDILYLEEGELVVAYIRASDVNGDEAKEKKVNTIEEIEVSAEVVVPKKKTFWQK